jgi:hypothetical protein
MQKNHEAYYQPYVSDSDDASSMTSSDTNDTEESMYEDPITSKKFQTELGAINLDAPQKQLTLRSQPKTGRGVEYSAFDLSGVTADLQGTGTAFNMVDGTYTSILMINSRDRDLQVYPQPTYLTLRLPRTYRNVVSFQITQMKLLSSFFYFRPDKQNVTLEILEQGRTLTENGQTVDNVVKVTIRTGTYDINSLLSELQTQLNRTPIFFYFPNGFSDFITLFTSTGDLSVNFNQPGDTFFNTLTDQYIANPTMTTITTTFFASRYAGLSTYTLSQVKIAYYYPVLYEMLLDPAYEATVDLTLTTAGPSLLPGETVRSRILYTFQGLNDPVVLEVINNNLNILFSPGVSILDNYRTLNTFKYSLVNEYKCSVESNNNRIVLNTSQLNTSLTTLLNQQTTAALISVLNSLNLTIQQYSNLVLSNSLFTAVFGNMYNFVQSNFANYFAVNFGTYAPVFFTNVSNAPFVQNGINATGVAKGYSLQLLQSAQEPISSSAQSLKSSPGYWPQIKTSPVDSSNNVLFIGAGLGTRQQDVSASFMNLPYNTYSGNFVASQQFIDNSGSVFISPTFGAGDCVTPIYNSKYTVFRFRSFVRQTLQVETLPLPYNYRYPPVTALNYSNPIPQHFDLSYSYVNSSYLVRTDISNISITFGQTNAVAKAAALNVEFTVRDPVKYYSFIAPRPVVLDASGSKYPVSLSFESVDVINISNKFQSPMNFFLYHDQGAFFADVSGYRNESPYNYKYTVESAIDLSQVQINFNVVGGNTYYIIARSRDLSFQNTRVKTFVYFPQGAITPIAKYIYDPFISPEDTPTVSFPVVDGASYNILYAGYYDPDFVRLPTGSNIQGADPSSQEYNKYLPISQSAQTPIGYDVSGISNDLTDYRGFSNGIIGNNPNTIFSVDPINLHTFQFLSPYSAGTSNYFYTGSLNSILQPITNTPYIPKTVIDRQFKIVQWYDTNYLPPQRGQQTLPSYATTQLANSRVFDASYGALSVNIGLGNVGATNLITYDASGNQGQASGGLNMGYGVPGFGFLPSEGTWNVQSFVFKAAFMELDPGTSNYVPDPNRQIKKIGIFPTNFITGNTTQELSLSTALAVLTYTRNIKYTPSFQTLNTGFDTVGGTYWEYITDSNFTKTSRLTINGYTPSVTYNFASNDYYSLIGFDTSGNVVPFYTPMGSYVPYPKVTQPTVQTSFSDSRGTYSAFVGQSNNLDLYQSYYVPSCNAGFNSNNATTSNFYPQDGNIYQSRYQQSIPIKSSLLHTLVNADFWASSNVLYPYPTDPTITSLVPDAYSFLTQDPILVFTKGPYFFWYTSEDLLQASLIITSNQNMSNTVSNVSIRTTSLFAGPVALQSIQTTGNYDPNQLIPGPPRNSNIFLGLTTNSSGATDDEGVYALYGSRFPTQQNLSTATQSYGYDFFVSKFFIKQTTCERVAVDPFMPPGPDFTTGLEYELEEEDLNSNYFPLYTDNYTFTKFFYRENIPTCIYTSNCGPDLPPVDLYCLPDLNTNVQFQTTVQSAIDAGGYAQYNNPFGAYAGYVQYPDFYPTFLGYPIWTATSGTSGDYINGYSFIADPNNNCGGGSNSGSNYYGSTTTTLNPYCMLSYTVPQVSTLSTNKSFWALAEYDLVQTYPLQYLPNLIFDACLGTQYNYGVKQNIIRCFNPNGYQTNDVNIFETPNQRTNYFWSDPIRNGNNSTIVTSEFYYVFDWSFGEDGYFNTLVNTVVGAGISNDARTTTTPVSFQFFRTNIQCNAATFSTVMTFYSEQFANDSAGNAFSGGLYNQLYIDISNNFYIQTGVPPNFTNKMYPDFLVNYSKVGPTNSTLQVATTLTPWLNFAGNATSQPSFVKIPSPAVSRVTTLFLDSAYTPQNYTFTESGSRPQDAINVGVSPLEPSELDTQFPYFVNRANNVQNPAIDWFPFVAQSFSVPYYKTQIPAEGIFIQAANRQFFWTNSAKLNITDLSGVLTLQSDISGNYDIEVARVSTLGTGGYSSTLTAYIADIPAGATTTQLNNYWSKYATNPVASEFYFNFCDIKFNSTTSMYTYSLLPQYGNNRDLPNQTITVKNVNVVNKMNNQALSVTISNVAVNQNEVSLPYPSVYGNNGLTSDTLAPVMNNVWNAFYPTIKIVLTKASANASTPITNTYDLIGTPPPPYDTPEHTSMFFYDNYTDMSTDLFGKFARESATRFKAYDVSSGYGFKSYIFNIPLSAYEGSTRDISANIGYNYLAVRGYSPTEKFNCLTRFYLPGRYDFGFISLQDLSNECQTVLVDLSGSPLVNPTYQTVLNAFNNVHKGTFNFGSNAIAGFGGSNYILTGWPSFLRTYITTYNTGTSNANLLSQINSNVQSIVANYITTYLSDILPSYVLTRERFTDPLLFSILFKSALSDEYKSLEYEWGLGWNLGFPKIDTPYDTIQRATSFYKILDDYIYLKMNNEFMMNRLDTSGPEKYSITHDPTGQTNQFTAKLLLAPFGSYAQTMIQNPILFNPVLTSIDKLTFNWVDLTGGVIDNFDCDWNAAVQIVEQVMTAPATSTIPKAQVKK